MWSHVFPLLLAFCVHLSFSVSPLSLLCALPQCVSVGLIQFSFSVAPVQFCLCGSLISRSLSQFCFYFHWVLLGSFGLCFFYASFSFHKPAYCSPSICAWVLLLPWRKHSHQHWISQTSSANVSDFGVTTLPMVTTGQTPPTREMVKCGWKSGIKPVSFTFDEWNTTQQNMERQLIFLKKVDSWQWGRFFE